MNEQKKPLGHGPILTKSSSKGWAYECFFCKKKFIFSQVVDAGMQYESNNTIVIGYDYHVAPHKLWDEKELVREACGNRVPELESEYEVAQVMCE